MTNHDGDFLRVRYTMHDPVSVAHAARSAAESNNPVGIAFYNTPCCGQNGNRGHLCYMNRKQLENCAVESK